MNPAARGVLLFMRAVIQRVTEASVYIGGEVKGRIAHGLLVFVAVEDADTPEDIAWLNDDAGLMNRSVRDGGGGLLVISQFTLFASTKMRLDTGVLLGFLASLVNAAYRDVLRWIELDSVEFHWNCSKNQLTQNQLSYTFVAQLSYAVATTTGSTRELPVRVE
jgi:D-tyrosyl-tRNA(Tyr) deacylase